MFPGIADEIQSQHRFILLRDGQSRKELQWNVVYNVNFTKLQRWKQKPNERLLYIFFLFIGF